LHIKSLLKKILSVTAAFFILMQAFGADFTVVNVGMTAYKINNVNNPTLTLQRGVTYVFSVSSIGHPFDIKTNFTTGSTDRYNNGVTGQGVTSGNLIFSVPASAPSTLFYHCEVHAVMGGTINIVDPPNTPPSVTITNPAAGAKFIAPANLSINADATDSDGSVTNVQFFSGANLLGNLTTAPFNFTQNNLAAGNYSFTAIAADNLGATATSAPVNIFVLTNATLTAPNMLPNRQFTFTVLGIAGQTYDTEASTDLVNWSAINTNIAPAASFNVTDAMSTNILHRFYRVSQP
jgi:hypothetical protein